MFANRFEPNAKEIAAYSEANLLSRDSNFFPSKGFLSPTRGQILSDDNGWHEIDILLTEYKQLIFWNELWSLEFLIQPEKVIASKALIEVFKSLTYL